MSGETDRELKQAIEAGAAALGRPVSSAAAAAMARLLLLLAHWSRAYNLTAIRDPAAMVTEHVLDALSIRPYLTGERIVDVGTGAGLPGLVLAIADPGRRFTLLDASGKKLRFVRHAVGELALANTEVVQARAEDYAPELRFDTVTARAFAPLPRLVGTCGHLLAPNGILLAQKGQLPTAEIAALPPAWRATAVALEVPGLEKERHAIILRRVRREETAP